jgi:hypothetical protein
MVQDEEKAASYEAGLRVSMLHSSSAPWPLPVLPIVVAVVVVSQSSSSLKKQVGEKDSGLDDDR